jgi:conjugative transposon TraM protein
MNINFKQPRFVLPIIILPFLCLFFYVWHDNGSKHEVRVKDTDGLNPAVGNVSGQVRKKQLADKLDAYRNTYKGADGLTAVAVIPGEKTSNPGFHNDYSDQQKHLLDSIQQAMRRPVNKPSQPAPVRYQPDNAVYQAVQVSAQPSKNVQPPRSQDPMDVFRQQMAIMDSVSKQNDPEWKAEQRKKELAGQAEKARQGMIKLPVLKNNGGDAAFNTVLPQETSSFISAVIDENVTGFAGSRIRIKLLEDINAGNHAIPKGTYLYPRITGFSEQRVTLTVTSILYDGKILPVKLDIYDQDGLPGLYVPASAFREFTKDLGGNAIQGVTIDGGTGSNQFMMSTLDKLFQSTSSAISAVIRKNKAKLKFNSFIYLIDPDELQNNQKKY